MEETRASIETDVVTVVLGEVRDTSRAASIEGRARPMVQTVVVVTAMVIVRAMVPALQASDVTCVRKVLIGLATTDS